MKTLKISIGLVLAIVAFACMLVGVPEWLDHFKMPNWLRYVLAIPFFAFCIFIGKATFFQFLRELDVEIDDDE